MVLLLLVMMVLLLLLVCGTDDSVMAMHVDVLDAVADDDDECGWIAACGRR